MSIKSSRGSARGSFTILRALTAASLFATGAAQPIGGSTDTDFLSLPSGKQVAVPIIDVDDTLTLHRLDMQQVTTLQRKIGDSDLASSCPSLGDRTNLYVEIKPSGGPDSIDCFLVKDLDKVIHRL